MLIDQGELDRTFDKGTSYKKWENRSYRTITSTSLPSLNFGSSANGASLATYKFSLANMLDQVVNIGNIRVRAPQLTVYAAGLTASTPWGPNGSNLSLLQSVNIHDQSSSSVLNQSANEIAFGGNLDLFARPHIHEQAHTLLNYSPPASKLYDGSDLWTQQGGLNLVPYSLNPNSESSQQTLVANSAYNDSAVSQALRMKQQFVFSATGGPGGVPAFTSKGPFDLCRLKDLGSGAATLDQLFKNFNLMIEIRLNGIAGQASSVAAFWSTIGPLYISLGQGLELAYDAVTLDPAADAKLISMYKHGFSLKRPYLETNIVAGLAGFNNSTATSVNNFLGPWCRPAAMICVAIPTGALTNATRSSFLHTQATFANSNLRSGNIPVNLEPTNTVEKAYESLCSWMDVDSFDGCPQAVLPRFPSYPMFQSFASYYVWDLRHRLAEFGDAVQNLNHTATRADSGGAVDYIYVVYTLKELTYECGPNGHVTVQQTA